MNSILVSARRPAAMLGSIGLVLLAALITCPVRAQTPAYTVENGSIALDGTAISGWDSTSNEGRGNGPFQGVVTHQTVDSPDDPGSGTGSLVFEASAAACSLSQDTLIADHGQEVTLTADLAWDAGWTVLWFGFFEYNETESVYEVYSGGVIDVIAQFPSGADTEGPLDSFHTVTVTFTLPDNTRHSPVRIYVGTSAGGFNGATVGAKVAIDNVRAIPPPPPPTPAAAGAWTLYE